MQILFAFRCMSFRVSPACFLKEQHLLFFCVQSNCRLCKEREALQRAVERNRSNIVWDYFFRNLFAVFVVTNFCVDLFFLNVTAEKTEYGGALEVEEKKSKDINNNKQNN
jgi:hypothetical protein